MNNLKIIAEIGSIHDGSFGNALKAVEAAIACGANVVKFQTHIAEAETLMNAPMPTYFTGEPRYQYFKRTAFSKNQWIELKLLTESLGADFLSSPFSNQSYFQRKDIFLCLPFIFYFFTPVVMNDSS